MADERLTLVEHLEELRRRIITCLFTILAAAVASWLLVKPILNEITKPVGKLIFISPYEAFTTYIKIAAFTGLFLSSPVVVYQFWAFVSKGLKESERKYLTLYGIFSLALFVSGASLAYFIVLPAAVKFLLGFATDSIVPMLSLSKYVSAVGVLLLVFGLAFQVPIVILFLSKLGLVTPDALARNRKYALLVIFIAAAMLTPGPDVFSQVVMGVPMYLLYEVSIFLARLGKKKCQTRK